MPAIRDRPVKCNICGSYFKNTRGVAIHIALKPDHQGIENPPSPTIPSYADPQFNPTNSGFHGPEWDLPLAPLGGGSDFGDGDVEQEVDEGPLDQVFEGAGSPLSIILTPQGNRMRMDQESPFPER